MTQEERQLLLKDLCGRLPYGVKVELHKNVCTLLGYLDDFVMLTANVPTGQQTNISNIKPYLRSMSSMTEGERNEYRKALDKDFTILEDSLIAPISYKYADGTVVRDRIRFHELDWLNKNMFDYRGLIPMGLALEAPEGMYKTE
jgi:hypothetical protein